MKIGPLRVMMAPPPGSALTVDALVLEEDTWQVLSASPEVVAPDEDALQLLRRLRTAQPLPPGSVAVRAGTPMQFHAVVYDFDDAAYCRPAWVAATLAEILLIAAQHKLGSLALPLLGVRHGRLPLSAFVILFVAALEKAKPDCLRQIWLLVPEEQKLNVHQLLDEAMVH